MKTTLSSSPPAEVETECLAVVVLDRTEKNRVEKSSGPNDKTEVSVETNDNAVRQATAEVIASGEVSGKLFEANLLHHPAKRLR